MKAFIKAGNANRMPMYTLVPSEGFWGARENYRIFIVMIQHHIVYLDVSRRENLTFHIDKQFSM
jgi:hypothetical protein